MSNVDVYLKCFLIVRERGSDLLLTCDDLCTREEVRVLHLLHNQILVKHLNRRHSVIVCFLAN